MQDTFVVYLPIQAEMFLSILCWALANILYRVSVIAQVSEPYLTPRIFLFILCWALTNFLNRVSVISQVSDPYVSTGKTHSSYTFRFKQRGFFPYCVGHSPIFSTGHL
ncbi:hypothetical protein GQR58_012904 [Nymphon striatum]|nr:hypothetical protein GQR58_012904 [Nymphon striatum]